MTPTEDQCGERSLPVHATGPYIAHAPSDEGDSSLKRNMKSRSTSRRCVPNSKWIFAPPSSTPTSWIDIRYLFTGVQILFRFCNSYCQVFELALVAPSQFQKCTLVCTLLPCSAGCALCFGLELRSGPRGEFQTVTSSALWYFQASMAASNAPSHSRR